MTNLCRDPKFSKALQVYTESRHTSADIAALVMTLNELTVLRIDHEARVTELLRANNREVERRRTAEHTSTALLSPFRTMFDFISEERDALLVGVCEKVSGQIDRFAMSSEDAEHVLAIETILRGADFALTMATRGGADPDARPTGPVAILCAEIGVPFTPEMETPETFCLFLRAMAAALRDHIETQATIAAHLNQPCDSRPLQKLEAFTAVIDLAPDRLAAGVGALAEDRDLMLAGEGDTATPADHALECVANLATALRIGLRQYAGEDSAFQSRHAAHAGGHICERIYRFALHDRHTADFQKRWMAEKFLAARAEAAA